MRTRHSANRQIRRSYRGAALGSTLSLVLLGALLGVVTLSGSNAFTGYTSTTKFCLSCHEMDIPYQEYTRTIHYSNPSGVRVGCSDCHVPRQQPDKLIAKIAALDDIYGHMVGVIDTAEKYEARRLHMAEKVWARMSDTQSKECRNCHEFETMDFEKQSKRPGRKHSQAMESGKHCIECHKGIAHAMPEGYDD